MRKESIEKALGENANNATYLFELPFPHYHASESFWSSLFALAVLDISRSGAELSLPTFRFQNGDEWQFTPDKPLIIPPGLDLRDVVVEGSLCSESFDLKPKSLHMDFCNLRPDVVIHMPDHVVIIETKTIGEKIGPYQKERYEKLTGWLCENHKKTSFFYLISAGHQPDRDWEQFRHDSDRSYSPRILLWEQVLKCIYQYHQDSFVVRSLGSISTIFKHEYTYLHSPATNP